MQTASGVQGRASRIASRQETDSFVRKVVFVRKIHRFRYRARMTFDDNCRRNLITLNSSIFQVRSARFNGVLARDWSMRKLSNLRRPIKSVARARQSHTIVAVVGVFLCTIRRASLLCKMYVHAIIYLGICIYICIGTFIYIYAIALC